MPHTLRAVSTSDEDAAALSMLTGFDLDLARQVNQAEGRILSSPGFCGGWFIWFRWLPVVIVPGGGGRGGCWAPRRLRARRGFASRWRSVAGWCPYQWTHSAVATSTASMSCQGPWLRMSSALYSELSASARALS